MRVTQFFGANPKYYARYGHKGHNGLDIACPTGTKFYAMLPGVWRLLTQGFVNTKTKKFVYTGYGAAWRLYFGTGPTSGEEWTFAHLQNRVKSNDGKNLPEGKLMSETDNTGDSTGPHLHITRKIIKNGKVQNYNNGFAGAVDPLPVMKAWGIKFTNA